MTSETVELHGTLEIHDWEMLLPAPATRPASREFVRRRRRVLKLYEITRDDLSLGVVALGNFLEVPLTVRCTSDAMSFELQGSPFIVATWPELRRAEGREIRVPSDAPVFVVYRQRRAAPVD